MSTKPENIQCNQASNYYSGSSITGVRAEYLKFGQGRKCAVPLQNYMTMVPSGIPSGVSCRIPDHTRGISALSNVHRVNAGSASTGIQVDIVLPE